MSSHKDRAGRLRQHIPFFVIAGIMLLTGAIGIISNTVVSRYNERLYFRNILPMEAIRHIGDRMKRYRLKVYQQVASIEFNEHVAAELSFLQKEIDDALTDSEVFYLVGQETGKFDQLKSHWKHLKTSYASVLEMSENYAKEEALEELTGENQRRSDALNLVLSELISLKMQGFERARSFSQRVQLWSLFVTMMTLLLGIGASLNIVLRYNRQIQGHIANLESQVAERTASLNAACKDLEEKKNQLEVLVTIDPLTGICNRRNFDELFAREWARACRKGGSLVVMMIDVDYFKSYNDNYGHAAGDQVLKRVAKTLQVQMKRPGDSICRYGGEEFIALLSDLDLNGAIQVAEKLRRAVEDLNITHQYSKISGQLSISVGVAVASLPMEEPISPRTLIQLADKMLYEAKENGRNQVKWTVKEDRKKAI